jgi:molybdenum cofactor guanylyltransferase
VAEARADLAPAHITGVVLAGGRGRRMQGRDKGLQMHGGQALARRALDRLRPQVGRLAVSANRHLDDYRSFGVPVWTDTLPDHPGPLAGWLAALKHAETAWVATVPCDTPDFPADLVARLSEALRPAPAGVCVAIACTDERVHPVFALLHRSLAPSLERALRDGERRVLAWCDARRAVRVRFADEAAFRNLNALDELD